MDTAENYVTAGFGIRSWIFTRDHKRVALLFLAAITTFFLVGGLLAVMMRLELLTPAGDVVRSDTYNKIFTLHGVLMVFFFLVPSIPAVLGNFLLPVMIGAQNLCFPRLSLASWYAFVAGGLCILWVAVTGGVDAGWTFVTPYASAYTHTNVTGTALGVILAGVASFLTGLNLLCTIHLRRAPGATWSRLPIFVWTHYFTGVTLLLGSPLGIYVFLKLLLGRHSPGSAADALLLQNLFWIFAEATVYVLLLPAIGVVSEIVACFSRRRIHGYGVMVFSTAALAALGIASWARHLPPGTVSSAATVVSCLLGLLLLVPTLLILCNLLATLYRGSLRFPTPMLYALGFLGLFLIGELASLFLAAGPAAAHLHGTAFETAQFHYLMSGAVLMAYLGGLHFWWPKITGRIYPEILAKVGAVVVFVGFNLAFFPLFVLGYLGMPARYHTYPPEFQVLQALSSAGTSILGFGYLLPVCYLVWSLRYGKAAKEDPWRARGLEWQTSSPPPTQNFRTLPTATGPAYAYGQPETPAEDARRP